MKNTLITMALLCGLCCAASAAPTFQVRGIFPLVEDHVHGSSIVECPNGDLLACWFQGSGERTADDVRVNGARLRKGEDFWSPIFLMADTPNFPDCNPVLFIDAQERLWLFWIAVQAHRWECSLLKYRRAEAYTADGPPTWSWQDTIMLKPGEAFAESMKAGFEKLHMDEEAMWAEYALPYTEMLLEAAKDPYKRQTGWMTRIHPLALPSGRILLPLYSDGFNASLVAISDDLGETWRASAPMIGAGPIQPTLIRKKDGTLVAYLRDSGGPPGRAMVSRSKDDGETWSPAPDTKIPNPGSSLEAIALHDGRWLLVCNDSPLGRGRLSAWFSESEGDDWEHKRIVEPCDDKGNNFSYPSVIQSKNGLVHLSYSFRAKAGGATIRQCTFDMEWTKKKE
jgi:predicted neuraminidase